MDVGCSSNASSNCHEFRLCEAHAFSVCPYPSGVALWGATSQVKFQDICKGLTSLAGPTPVLVSPVPWDCPNFCLAFSLSEDASDFVSCPLAPPTPIPSTHHLRTPPLLQEKVTRLELTSLWLFPPPGSWSLMSFSHWHPWTLHFYFSLQRAGWWVQSTDFGSARMFHNMNWQMPQRIIKKNTKTYTSNKTT